MSYIVILYVLGINYSFYIFLHNLQLGFYPYIKIILKIVDSVTLFWYPFHFVSHFCYYL
jgi:hypothetical protein